MDGIDDIAGSQSAGTFIGGGLLRAAGEGMALFAALLWAQRPSVFVVELAESEDIDGDASNGFLGYSAMSLAVVAGQQKPELGLAWLILPGFLITDAALTLLRRLARGAKVHVAHRSHAYQKLARRCGHHFPVTVATIVFCWLWLFPIGYCIAAGVLPPLAGILLAYAPIAIGVMLARAGQSDQAACTGAIWQGNANA